MRQQELFQPAAPKPLTDRQVQDLLFGEIIDLAKGNLDAIGTAVRRVLNKHYHTYVQERGRWVYLANRLTRRAKRALRDTAKLRQQTRARA